MVEFIFNKISSYNILNYLIPGTVLCLLLEYLLGWSFFKFGNWYEAGVVFYFVGMVNSRIGSLVIEPILKKIWGNEFCAYRDYVIAEKNDSMIAKLNMENNVFRSFISVSFVLLLAMGWDALVDAYPQVKSYGVILVVIVVLVLFVHAYLKQVRYISKRVNIAVSCSDKNES